MRTVFLLLTLLSLLVACSQQPKVILARPGQTKNEALTQEQLAHDQKYQSLMDQLRKKLNE